MKRTQYLNIPAYQTRDGSLIRELMHPSQHASRHQSLAEAVVRSGTCTALHRHHKTEELYHITAGQGRMTLGTETFPVQVGDTICIPPGTAHCIENTGDTELRILCSCCPPYSHDDTEIL